MLGMDRGERISIRPGVTILSVLRHLNYRPWYAIAEFVDNSLQSFLTYREELERVSHNTARLEVSIELSQIDGGRITIRDNAAGIHEADYRRAFRPAAIPPDQSGLSEFGMGMKSAACWFSPKWTVRTTALGEDVERTVHFDISSIVRDELEELSVILRPEERDRHYTEIVLTDLYNPPQGQTIAKIKRHLASIYRIFIRQGILLLRFDDQVLSYEDPKVLRAPYFKDPQGESRLWRKEVDLDLGLGLKATGFAALRETASTATAGFALFRRDRLIEGSADEAYRPTAIFGHPNSYTYQRLFGELHLSGFEVSHTKDGFRWEEHEQTFLELLGEDLDKPPLSLLRQAEGYRARLRLSDVKTGAMIATERTAEAIQRDAPKILDHQIELSPDGTDPDASLPDAPTVAKRVIDIELHGIRWEITLEMSVDPALSDWIEICDHMVPPASKAEPGVRRLGMRMALSHPFMERFAGADQARIEPLLRIGAALALGETTARESGVKKAGTIRRNLNELLRDALSKP